MIDPGLKDKVVLVTGGNNPYGIGAAVAKAFAAQSAKSFIHFFRQKTDFRYKEHIKSHPQEPGLEFFFEQQRKTADEVVTAIRNSGAEAESWEGDLRDSKNVNRLFDEAEKAFG